MSSAASTQQAFSTSSVQEFVDLVGMLVPHLTSVCVSNLSAEAGFTPVVCSALVAALPGLVELFVDSASSSPGGALGCAELRPFLVALRGIPDGADHALPVCPLLRSIALSYAVLDNQLVRNLQDMLNVRARSGCKLRVLCLLRAVLADGVDRSHIEPMLREHVNVLVLQIAVSHLTAD